MEPTRELYWNISGYWVMYVLFIAVVACFVFFFHRRYRLWKLGTPKELQGSVKERLVGAVADVFTQRRVVKEKGPGFMHLAIFWGMLFCLLATTFVALQADFGLQILYGDFYLYFISLAVDLAGFVCIIGVVIALVRRLGHFNKNLDSEPADILMLVLLLIILISGFVTEGLRIVGTNDPWAYWSPIGYIFSLMFAQLDEKALSLAHQIIWWSHMELAFAFLATFTYTKMVHALFIPGNVYFRSLDPKGTIEPIDFEDEDLETMGVQCLEEFTWKDIYDTQACIRCGRCQANCPAFLSDKQLSPKDFIQNMRKSSEERGKILLNTLSQSEAGELKAWAEEEVSHKKALAKKPLRTEEQEAFLEQPVVGDVLSKDALWECTTCRSCAEQCPARIEHPDKIIKLRTYQVSMESAFPSEAQQAFRNMETNGNPWGIGWQKRTDWTKDLDVPTLEENPDAEYLYWPGCSGAFDARSKKVSMAIVSLLKVAKVNFAILGNAEKCCGDSARRLGNEYVYYLLASENIETLNSYGVKKIVTQCPHCLHALSVDYPQMGGNYEVIHHSQLLAELISQGKLTPQGCDFKTVTYHDSCYLGRYHDIFEQPRNVIKQAGAQVVEMDRNHSRSFCCGAGGGHMWLEEKEGSRINNMRAQQALDTNAEALISACPFCLTMLSDGIAANEKHIPVKDLAEILAESCKTNS
jgi:Fe-S oxidoreductase/nitrate reductase gamma subunit